MSPIRDRTSAVARSKAKLEQSLFGDKCGRKKFHISDGKLINYFDFYASGSQHQLEYDRIVLGSGW